MRYRPPKRRSRAWYILVLVLLCTAALLMPDRWSGRLVNFVQVLVPAQDALAPRADVSTPDNADAVRQEQLARENAALRHQTAALALRLEQLEDEVRLLTGTRLWDAGGQRLGTAGRLVPAKVVVGDILPWRSSGLISAGSLQGVRPGALVASRHFTIELADEVRRAKGLAILLGEILVGEVTEHVGTHTARFKLLSDVSTQMKVRIGRLSEEGFTAADGYFWLRGRGYGVMEITDAQRRQVEGNTIAVGDIVLSDPRGAMLPAAMTIGTVTDIRTDPKNPLLVILTVTSGVDINALSRVYVFDPKD